MQNCSQLPEMSLRALMDLPCWTASSGVEANPPRPQAFTRPIERGTRNIQTTPMTIQKLNCDEVKTKLAGQKPPVLIDVSNPEDFAVAHLPGAQNACVFEVDFLDQVEGLEGIRASLLARAVGADPNRCTAIVVYGNCARSLASATAAEKLAAASFTHVQDFRGGLEEWRAAGLPVEGTDASKAPPALEDRDYPIDPKASTLEWTGRNLTGKHHGTIALLPGGKITLKGGRVTGGSITLDMATISSSDLAGSPMQQVLEGHLKSDDFFHVALYPQAQIFIDAMEEIADAAPGNANYTVRARLRLKDVENRIVFPAQVGPSPEAEGALVARANFDFDRTEWNVRYGSGKFYEKLGKHLVSDLISVELKIVAR